MPRYRLRAPLSTSGGNMFAFYEYCFRYYFRVTFRKLYFDFISSARLLRALNVENLVFVSFFKNRFEPSIFMPTGAIPIKRYKLSGSETSDNN